MGIKYVWLYNCNTFYMAWLVKVYQFIKGFFEFDNINNWIFEQLMSIWVDKT